MVERVDFLLLADFNCVWSFAHDQMRLAAHTMQSKFFLFPGIKPAAAGNRRSAIRGSPIRKSGIKTYLPTGTGSAGVKALASEAKPLYFFPVFLTIPRETRFWSFS